MRSSSSLRRSGLWLGVAAVGVIGAWSLVLAAGDGSQAAPSLEAEVVAGVCAALAASADGGDARAVFYDRAHDGLHELASDTASQDRAVAGRLLRSKERVEVLLEGAPPAQTTTALKELSEAAVDAASVVDPSSSQECE